LDHCITAVIFGFFASAWFGWAHGGVSPSIEPWLDAGSGIAVLIAIAAVITAFRVPRERAVMRDRSQSRRYGIIVGIEFGTIGIGAAVLSLAGAPDWVAVWVLTVVGVHFFSLAPLLNNRSLYPLGWLLLAIAAAALIVALSSAVAPAGVTGIGGGISLGAVAAYDLIQGLRPTRIAVPG
jgi:hypothetical protein